MRNRERRGTVFLCLSLSSSNSPEETKELWQWSTCPGRERGHHVETMEPKQSRTEFTATDQGCLLHFGKCPVVLWNVNRGNLLRGWWELSVLHLQLSYQLKSNSKWKVLFKKETSVRKRGYMKKEGIYIWKKIKVLVTQWCLTLCDPMDCSPPDSSVHGIL